MLKVIQIVLNNIEQTSIGGHATTLRNYVFAFPDEFAFVATTDRSDLPTGRWFDYKDEGTSRRVFLVGRIAPYGTKGIVPGRIKVLCLLKRHRKAILSLGIRNVIVHSGESLIAVQNWGWDSLCYVFPGTENPIERSRFAWARPFAGVFDSLVFSALKKCSLVLASADERAIMDVVGRSKGELRREDITRFPTRVDLKMFYPTPATEARTRLGLDADASVVVFCGRLNGVKGWRLALDAFYDFQRTRANAAMLFVGDGEDRNALSLKVDQLGLSGKVRLLGSVGGAEVPAYLNAASVVVVTSLYEGWSQTMLEALACGKPIVSTDVSGARDLIKSGENGYVVNSRDPKAFATAMVESLGLPHSAAVSLDIVKPYALASLSHDLKALWPALHDR